MISTNLFFLSTDTEGNLKAAEQEIADVFGGPQPEKIEEEEEEEEV